MTIELNIANTKVDLPENILKELELQDRLNPKKKKKKSKGNFNYSVYDKMNQVFPDINPKGGGVKKKKFTPSLSVNSQKEFDLHNVCFKMNSEQVHAMDELKAQNLYFSRSEIIRVACRELLKKDSTELEKNTIFQFSHDKDSVSAKLPQILLYCIDQLPEKGFYESRSTFIRKALDNFFIERELFHTYFANYKTKHKKLKVIAFKLSTEQISNIKDLCNEGFYGSLSEVVRIAIVNYLVKVITFNTEKNTLYWLSVLDQKNLSDWSTIGNNISACSKIPFQLLDILDEIIMYNGSFGNRTNFIRLAVEKFLAEDSQIYTPYLISN